MSDLVKIKKLNRLLPLVAIGTVADCQSILQTTNRILVKAGLKILNQKPNAVAGLNELLNLTYFSQKMESGYQLTSQEIAFYLSPILNSSGRINHSRLSIRTLLPSNFQFKSLPKLNNPYQDFAKELVQTNKDRKAMVQEVITEIDTAAKQQVQQGKAQIWLEGDWSKGLVGLIASRLESQYHLPVVVVSLQSQEGNQTDLATASLRAPEGFHIPKALKLATKNLTKFGGHPEAAGFSAQKDNLSQVKQILNQAFLNQAKKVKTEQINWLGQEFDNFLDKIQHKIEVDDFGKIERLKYQKENIFLKTLPSFNFIKQIFLLEPFGQDFPMPKLIFSLKIKSEQIRLMGKGGEHIKIEFDSDQANLNSKLELVSFNLLPSLQSKLKELIQKNQETEILFVAKVSQTVFQNTWKLQLIADELFWLKETKT